MKTTIKILRSIAIIFIVVIIFRGFLYRVCFSYEVTQERKNIELTNLSFVHIIDSLSKDDMDIHEIMALSQELTNENLTFTFTDVSPDPNSAIEIGKANCIGYSSMYNAIGNYLIRKKGLASQYKFVHVVGKISFLGMDIHGLFDSSFFKNHDFNQMIDKDKNELIAVDPSLNDYFWIDFVACK